MKKILIVGGVAGGASMAARLRRVDENAQIIMFEKGEYISFANCGLPYYIGGTITDRQKLLVETVENMSQKFNLDIRNLSEVVKIDRENKTVTVMNHRLNEEYTESYDVLVLSPGASPLRPNIPGINECTNLFTLRNIPDTDTIKSYVSIHDIKKAVVVGGGFIGLEMTENLVDLGINVTLVEMANQVMAPIDIEMAAQVHDHLQEHGVRLVLEDGVAGFAEQGRKITLTSGMELDTDLVILAIGVAPETKFAQESGIKTNARGAIVVDDKMRTNDESIYALGDAVAIKDFVNGEETMIPLAWPANRQGHIVADNIAGMNARYRGTLGSSVAKVFDLTVASTGNNEKVLQAKGIDYEVLHIHPGSHAGYYPGAFPIHLKLIFSKSGRILGAQGVGIDGVAKRIDVLATAIKGKLSVYDLPDLELCYAPPYSSAKDPVNMAGYDAVNMLDGLVKTVQWHEIDDIAANGAFVLDVREEFELATGVIENSVNIPLGQIRNNLNKIPKDQPVYVYCQVGQRGYVAARMLSQLGYDAINLDGGFKTYKNIKFCRIDHNPVVVDRDAKEVHESGVTVDASNVKIKIDACGLQCPGPIRRVFEEINKLEEGDVLEIQATDPGFGKDIVSWCDNTGNTLLSKEIDSATKATVAKIAKGCVGVPTEGAACDPRIMDTKNGSTMVVFSQDLDKAIASFIIATGAAAMGKEVTMFFTFWGLNILKKKNKPSVKKDLISKMFGIMLPSHASKLPLSNMNMGGMGAKIIKYIMKKNNVDPLEEMMENAMNMGVKVVACAMSMDLMGIAEEELMDGVEIAGVASYLGATENSNHNLFI